MFFFFFDVIALWLVLVVLQRDAAMDGWNVMLTTFLIAVANVLITLVFEKIGAAPLALVPMALCTLPIVRWRFQLEWPKAIAATVLLYGVKLVFVFYFTSTSR